VRSGSRLTSETRQSHASQVVGPGIESGATIVEEIVHLFWKVDVAQRKMHAMQSNPWQISGSGRAVSTKQENHLQQLKRRNAYVVTAQIIWYAHHKETKRFSLCINSQKRSVMRETVRQVFVMSVNRSTTRFSIIDNQFRSLVYRKIRYQTQVIWFLNVVPLWSSRYFHRHRLVSQYSVEPVLLGTAVVLIKNRAGTYVSCCTLLDSRP